MILKTQNGFAGRCLHLCAGIGLITVCVSWQLVKLQIIDEDMNAVRAGQTMIEFDSIPAQRGVIMDRNEELLTNNILSVSLIADRYHLRDPKMVCWGLANNIASHDATWSTLGPEQRTLLIRRTYQSLLRRAEKKGVHDYSAVKGKSGAEGAREMLKESYDENICEMYYRAHDELVAEWLSPCLQMEPQAIVDKIRQDGSKSIIQKIVLARDLTEEKADEIRRLLSSARIRGFSCESVLKRSYASPESLCHVLGYVDYENEGISGIEAKFNGYLKGQNGSREFRRDARGLIVPSEGDRFKEPIHGQNLILTIDMRLQTIAEQELAKGIEHNRAARGAVVIVEPKTGDILALASYPSFNLNTKKNQGKAALNYAVQGVYEPGSTFKVVAVTAAVDSGKLKFGDHIDCNPFYVPGRKTPITDKPFGNKGIQPVPGVLKFSSNPGACKVGFKAGWSTYKEYLERFGLTKRSGVDLPSEGRCMMQDGKKPANFAPMTFGYAITVTPLHMAMVYAAIANDGVRMKPRLIKKITSADGAVVDECEPQVVAKVMSPKTARGMLDALHSVTTERGTGTRAAIPGYNIGGKTGTSHKVKESGGGYYSNRYTVSFAGVAPIEDPAFVCLVVIDDPHPTDVRPGGGTVAAPIFKNVAQRVFDTLNIPPTDQKAVEKARRDTAVAQNVLRQAPPANASPQKTVSSASQKRKPSADRKQVSPSSQKSSAQNKNASSRRPRNEKGAASVSSKRTTGKKRS